jgi:hypothetical protein
MRPTRPRLRFEVLEARDVPALPGDAPQLPPPPANAVHVDTVAELENAVANLQSGQTVVVAPGTYQLTRTLFIGKNSPVQNVTIRGATNNFNDVVIRGLGMDGPFNSSLALGISVYNAQDVTIANLSVGEVYWHAIDLQGVQGADRVNLYHCRFFNAGEQIIKSNAGGGGVDDVKLEYCLIEYSTAPSVLDHGGGTGYVGGLHAHETDRWQIRHNLWRNFHTPDTVTHWYSPTVLMWNASADTIVEGNTFIDTDRAIAFGLIDKAGTTDHRGGVIRNNFIYQRPGLFSATRRANSDGQILVYDSPDTQVYHNTVLTNNNSRFSLETRWLTTGVAFDNNLADAPFSTRNGGTYTAAGNYLLATPSMFVSPSTGNLHLVDNAATRASVIDKAVTRAGATNDFDIAPRPSGSAADVGADELVTSGGSTGSAVFRGSDSATQGNWSTAYGSEGYRLAQGASSLPGYAQMSVTGHLNYTWAASTANVRALRKPNSSDRLAACWYNSSSFMVNLNLTGGTHRVSAYFLDWDNRGRVQRVEVLDAATGAVLDTRTVSGFSGGRYLTWDLSGSVRIRVTKLGGPNAVLSGLFFGQNASSGNSAVFRSSDGATQGNWSTAYGADGYRLAQGASSLPPYAQVGVSGHLNYTWAASTTDPRALRKPNSSDRLAACWYNSSSFTVDLTVSGGVHRVSAYFLDWDNRGRVQRVEVLDATTGAVLDTRTISGFSGGRYLTWDISGSVKIRVTNVGGVNAVLSGLFFG